MFSYQSSDEQGSILTPTLEITAYDDGTQDLGNHAGYSTTHPGSSSREPSANRQITDAIPSGSNTERDTSDMSSRSTKQPSSFKRHSGSPKTHSKAKTDDWTEVTEPEERRRIQNRIAQRKFRESFSAWKTWTSKLISNHRGEGAGAKGTGAA